ncbi:hypothetical protein PsorP6_017390 [Peronosclerospora sorghi]|uniref:Uncharacterized protein n=1 Tax=Peronosclerospora sorghi TaxID=230839 RepID=A0ACC0WM99_9STRA|nr:hypothetical protein PsorP6_017390 [Peronosclerospora sorghi]
MNNTFYLGIFAALMTFKMGNLEVRVPPKESDAAITQDNVDPEHWHECRHDRGQKRKHTTRDRGGGAEWCLVAVHQVISRR